MQETQIHPIYKKPITVGFRDIIKLPGYKVNENSEIKKTYINGQEVLFKPNKTNYSVSIYRKFYFIRDISLEAFFPEALQRFQEKYPGRRPIVIYLDGNSTNHHIMNLAYITDNDPTPEERIHPLYNLPYTTGFRTVAFNSDYEVNHNSEIRSKINGIVLNAESSGRVTMTKNRKKKHYNIYFVSLSTFFPEQLEKFKVEHPRQQVTVDHYDENSNNHSIDNLSFMTNEDNARKSVKLRPRNNAIACSRPILQLDEQKDIINEFKSIKDAHRRLKIHYGSISRSCRQGGRAGGFYFRFKELESQKDLLDETWMSSKTLIDKLEERGMERQNARKVTISDKGRVITVHGIKTRGARNHRHPKYLYYAHYTVHQLVWFARYDEDPWEKGLYILHNDSMPLNPDGSYTNHLDTLRLGTASENSIEHHAHKRAMKERDVENEQAGKRQKIEETIEDSGDWE